MQVYYIDGKFIEAVDLSLSLEKMKLCQNMYLLLLLLLGQFARLNCLLFCVLQGHPDQQVRVKSSRVHTTRVVVHSGVDSSPLNSPHTCQLKIIRFLDIVMQKVGFQGKKWDKSPFSDVMCIWQGVNHTWLSSTNI